MVRNSNYSDCGDHFEMYRNIESLCCNRNYHNLLAQLYVRNKQAHEHIRRKTDQICGYQMLGVGKGNQTKIA